MGFPSLPTIDLSVLGIRTGIVRSSREQSAHSLFAQVVLFVVLLPKKVFKIMAFANSCLGVSSLHLRVPVFERLELHVLVF